MKISASSFVSFLSASGRGKVAAVAKCREPYRPERDFYKRWRQALDKASEVGNFDEFPKWDQLSPNATKQKHFQELTENLETFVAESKCKFLPFSRKYWRIGSFQVSTSSTARLSTNGQASIVLFWLKSAEPSRNEIEYLCSILKLTYSERYPRDGFAILDIRRRRLLTSQPDDWLEQYLFGECAAFQSIWDSLEEAA